jgi:hypothetical protein
MAKRLDIGATCSVGARYLHPKKRLLKERFSSTTPKQWISGLLSLRKESKKLNEEISVALCFDMMITLTSSCFVKKDDVK